MPAYYGQDFGAHFHTSREESWFKTQCESLHEWCKINCEKGYMVFEPNKNDSRFHFQFAMVLRYPVRTDYLKKQLLRVLDLSEPMDSAESKYMFVVSHHHNPAGLAGGYLTKYGPETIILDQWGFTEDELAAGKLEHDTAKRKRAMYDVSKTQLWDVLSPYIEYEFGKTRICIETYDTDLSGTMCESEIRAGIMKCMKDGYNIGHLIPHKLDNYCHYFISHIQGFKKRKIMGVETVAPSVQTD